MASNLRTRYLTKSRFKLALECPTKLYYIGKPDQYVDSKSEDDFLKALAEGGFQVGELAKLMFPGGVEVESRSHEEQLTDTAELLKRPDVTIFEAAISHGNLFARVDVLCKTGSTVALIEVKAKSFDSETRTRFRGARGAIKSELKPYLQDIAFQRHVLGLAHPQLEVSCYLMLADKAKTCSVDGLNQRFSIRLEDGRPVVAVRPGTDENSIGAPILNKVPVDDLVNEILRNPVAAPGMTASLAELATNWGEWYQNDLRIPPTIGAHCAKCEFRTNQSQAGKRSGFHDCWREAAGLSESEIARGTVLELWNFTRKQELIDQRVFRMEDIPLETLSDQGETDGLSRAGRQIMQLTGRWPGRSDFYLDAPLMNRELHGWVFPLHFIDFETSRVAIPFFAGQRPYDNIAFQFSHHTVDENGRIEHRSQFLSTTPGRRPNYDFVRALQVALGKTGTILMWSSHENTTLNAIEKELKRDLTPPEDAADLVAFIRSLTTRKLGSGQVETGERAMVDQSRLSEKAFYHPATKGSNSIKKVLPAVMKSSNYLMQKYSKPIYGHAHGIPSLNFPSWVWWREENGNVVDPYRLLPPVFNDLPRETVDAMELDDDHQISQGGAATVAFARLQFEDTDPTERKLIEKALLRYCELDTLAMVMIYESWKEWTNN
jgi:hypothetical protein